MKKRYVKKSITLLLVVLINLGFTASTVNAWDWQNDDYACKYKRWVSFDVQKGPRLPKVEILRPDEKTCEILITIYGMYTEHVKAEGRLFEKLTIPWYGYTSETGKPQLPVIRGLIEIPWGKKASVTATVLSSFSLDYLGFPVYPAQEPVPECQMETDSDFEFDQEFYCSDAYYPNILASLSSPAQLRSYTIVQLNVYPVRFNPAIAQLNVSSKIKLKIDYHESDTPTVSDRLHSPAFEKICKAAIWNHHPHNIGVTEPQSVGYLIISPDNFSSSLTPFVEWKTANGFNVTLVRLSEIGLEVSDTTVYNYISNAFHNWTTPPTYVLLVGDVEHLPTHYGLIHPCSGDRTATDHYYACMNANDYLPDLFVGRLSVKNVSELNNTIDKIINYHGAFNQRATLVSDSEHFEETSEWINDLLSAEGWTVDRLYASYGTATTSNIVSALNEGRSIINYRGHGGPTGWGTGSFYNSDVLMLNNEGKYPIVVSCTCSTGEYDYDASDCFGETWMKTLETGAVAFWGSSRVSYSGYNDELSKGFFKAVFNDGLHEFALITVQAKLYMYDYYGWDGDKTQLQYEMYNVLTDPGLVCFQPQDHDLAVSLDAPHHLEPGSSTVLNATVRNRGLDNETDVELHIIVNNESVNTETVPQLLVGASYTINYSWTPTEAAYNVTAYAPPVSGENITTNNVISTMIYVRHVDVALISDRSELLSITTILDSLGIGYDIYNDNAHHLYTEHLHLLLDYPTVIFYNEDRPITSHEHSALESYLAERGNLLVTGYDSLGHPNDPLLADIVCSSSMGDNTDEPDLYVRDFTHPIMNGPYRSFSAGQHISGLYSDCDRAEADDTRNAVTVAELADGYDKIIAAEGLTGKVVYWNGKGPDDWTQNRDCEAIFKNILTWFFAPADFEITVSPRFQTILPGQSINYTVDITPKNGFNSSVFLSLSGLPTHARFTFVPQWVLPVIERVLTFQSISQVFTEPRVAPGIYNLTITGSSNEITHTANVTLTIDTPATINIPPISYHVGKKLAVDGAHFSPNSQVCITFDDMLIGYAPADDEGSFTFIFNIPVSEAGTHAVKAYDEAKYADATLTVTDATPLDIEFKGGGTHFRGEFADFYVLTKFKGNTVDAAITSVLLYKPDDTTEALLAQRIETGIYKITYAIPGEAPTGTYALVIEATYSTRTIDANQTSLECFQLSPTLTNMKAWIYEIKDNITTLIIPDLRTIKVNLTAIQAKVTAIDGATATIQTTLGTITADLTALDAKIMSLNGTVALIHTVLGEVRTDMQAINATIIRLDGTTAEIRTAIGTIQVTLDDIQLKAIAIDGATATIQTTLGKIQGNITSIQDNIAAIETEIGTVKVDISSLQETQDLSLYVAAIGVFVVITLLAVAFYRRKRSI